MERFADWLWNATNTSHDEVFDVGGSTKMSIFKNTGGNSRLLVSEMKAYKSDIIHISICILYCPVFYCFYLLFMVYYMYEK